MTSARDQLALGLTAEMKGVLDRLRFRRDHRWLPQRASDYLDGDLGSNERARLERHRDECPECSELLRSLKAIVGALGTLRGDDSELVAGAVLASVKRHLGEPPRDGV